MREEGVQVLDSAAGGGVESRSGIEWSADIQQAVSTAVGSLLVLGTTASVRKALAEFRPWQPKSKVEVEDESGDKLVGYL